ncbi:MAG: cyclase family protein [Chloroflexi bacterium]|nr:cyclase family protein [Chloroflexota bacterium]
MRLIELNHVLEDGMRAYPGLPSPRVGAFLDHEASRGHYGGEAEFYIGKVDMVCSLGTYLDSPYHRHRDGADLSGIPLEKVAALAGIALDGIVASDRSTTADCDEGELRDRAVLIRTGWDERWGTDSYWEPGPYLAPELIETLIRSGATLVGVDFHNVDDTTDLRRPAHTRLLAEGILIVENLCNLAALPREGFRFYAVPPRITPGASFPVRAFAEVRERRRLQRAEIQRQTKGSDTPASDRERSDILIQDWFERLERADLGEL